MALETLKQDVSEIIAQAPIALSEIKCSNCGEVVKEFHDKLKEAREELQVKAVKDLSDHKLNLDVEMRKLVNDEMEKMRKAQEPPKPEELEKLLSQEYLEFTLVIPTGTDKRTFIIRELPQAVEKKFYKAFTTVLKDRLPAVAGISWNLLEGSLEEKLKYLMDAFEPVFDLMAEAAALSLNPRNEMPEIDRTWVQNNLSSSRIYNIVMCQVEASRLRDFIFSVFRTATSVMPNQR